MKSEKQTLVVEHRSEEVSDIIDRMPVNFGFWTTSIIGFMIIALLAFGWLIKYPDILNGQITISASTSPVKMVSTASGKLQLKVKSFDHVEPGTVIGYISNPASVSDVLYLKGALERFDNSNPSKSLIELNNRKFALGELTDIYYRFLNALQLSVNYDSRNVMVEQFNALNKLKSNQTKSEQTLRDQLSMGKQNLALQRNIFRRDSILYSQKVLTVAELERSKMNLLSAIQNFRSVERELINIQESIGQTNSQLQQVDIQSSDKNKQVKLDYIGGLNNLKENIKSWEQKYCFITPIGGTVQFLKFWKNEQFVGAGEEMFTVVPNNNDPVGELILPSFGAGKVAKGQEVTIKLADYPYLEYGSITGKVESISLIGKTQKTNETQQIDTYLVLVKLPNKLITNYDINLDFKFELKGTAEIITKDKRLIERFFDNLKYIKNK